MLSFLLPVAVSIIDLLTQLAAVLFCKDRLDTSDQCVIGCVKLMIEIHVETFPIPLHPVKEQIPILGVAHESVLTLDNDNIKFVSFQILKQTVIFIPAFYRSTAFCFHISVNQCPALFCNAVF